MASNVYFDVMAIFSISYYKVACYFSVLSNTGRSQSLKEVASFLPLGGLFHAKLILPMVNFGTERKTFE